MKSTILLTTALFLVSAPSPDSTTISEFSGGFLSNTTESRLMAADKYSDLSGAAKLSTMGETSPTKLNLEVAHAAVDSGLGPDKNR